MYRQAVAHLKPGMVLAQSLRTERGDVLLAAGTAMTPFYIQSIQRRGYISVYVEDGLADDVEPADIVSEQVRASTTSHVARVYEVVGKLAQDSREGPRVRPRTVDDAIRRLGPRQLELPKEGARMLEALYSDIERIMDEILEANTVTSLESLKSHNSYTFEHSVDVGIVGILLGKKAGLHQKEMRELALGCLLHDIGKMYIDEAILDKPDRLTVEEFEEVKKHPLMGFELVRRMPIMSSLPAHVAYQHHERQDGNGYPRGLIGNNRLIRTMAESMDPRRILMIAEIAAVADVYSALTSDRPYRPAMPLDRCMRVLLEMSDSHLNREVVRMLRRTIPAYPVGHWVAVTEGMYRGWRGVVTAVHTQALDRPLVRLLLDPRGETVPPVEIDLATSEEAEIGLVPGGDAPYNVEQAS
ncbi:MAG: HD domain-containing protein [Chloroflexi bacterium]|nr:HD domain-containing protein [Chloroflexota bacterium]